jgi:hypothetical protein
MHYSIFSAAWAAHHAQYGTDRAQQSGGKGNRKRNRAAYTLMERLAHWAMREATPIRPCRSGASEIQEVSGPFNVAPRSSSGYEVSGSVPKVAPARPSGLNRYCFPVGLPLVHRLHHQRCQHQCSEDKEYHIHGSFLSHARPGRATTEDIPFRYFLLYAYSRLTSIAGRSLSGPYLAGRLPALLAGRIVCQSYTEMLY